MSEKQSNPPGSGKRAPVPVIARGINTAIVAVLLGLSVYHYTQPNAAWRSGTTELVCALLLLTAAYFVSHIVATVINLFVAIPVIALGIRHLTSVKGWRSGIAELCFAVLLIIVAYLINRDRKKHKLSG
jgi:hypothetical protein